MPKKIKPWDLGRPPTAGTELVMLTIISQMFYQKPHSLTFSHTVTTPSGHRYLRIFLLCLDPLVFSLGGIPPPPLFPAIDFPQSPTPTNTHAASPVPQLFLILAKFSGQIRRDIVASLFETVLDGRILPQRRRTRRILCGTWIK